MAEETKELEVGRGCLDCVHYDKPTNKEPCKACERWSKWKNSKQKSIVQDVDM